MDMWTRFGLLASLMTVIAGPVAAQSGSETAATPRDTSPPAAAGASSGLIARGDEVFHGSGNCYACHGSKGEGLVGPNLTDAEWIHSKGTLAEIEAQINHGVPKEESKSGIPMPPKGGATISDEDVKAVAAYVYSLGQKSGS
jgi:mono/diheme cytochrome c family protein